MESGCRGSTVCPTVVGMRIGPLLLAVGVLLALAGCVPSTPHATAAPSASATPVFASDAEALAAAEKAYAAYEAVVDSSLQSASDTGLAAVASGSALTSAIESVDSFKKAGQFQRGESLVTRVTGADLSTLTMSADSAGPAQIYACLDVSGVTVVDSAGNVVSGSNRQTLFPTLVSLEWKASSRDLLVSEEAVWDGANFCS